jgi:CobQ-like glutamine amidotransferase family enzyme
MTKKISLTIAWLYPDLMSTYGDRGNVIVLKKRCERRNINVTIKSLSIGANPGELDGCDLFFMGGAQDRQQKIVSDDFSQGKAEKLTTLIEANTPGLYICGAYQFLGKYYKEADGTIINGLGILDLYTENPGDDKPRLIGNIVIESELLSSASLETMVGFENHGGRTYLGTDIKPLGKVIKGHGNNGHDQGEGAIYKNTFGSYLHGPLLPKNPGFADLLLSLALENKYKEPVALSPLDDIAELQAHNAIVSRLTGRV